MRRWFAVLALMALSGCGTPEAPKKLVAATAESPGDIRVTEEGGVRTADPWVHTNDNPPAFTCCERKITSEKPPKTNVSPTIIPRAPGRDVILLATIEVPVTFSCVQQEVERACIASYLRIDINSRPKLDGNSPNDEKAYWNETRGKCDGKDYKGAIKIVYKAAYGVRQAAKFEGPLTLTLVPPFQKGDSKKLEITFSEIDEKADPPKTPTAKDTDLKNVP